MNETDITQEIDVLVLKTCHVGKVGNIVKLPEDKAREAEKNGIVDLDEKAIAAYKYVNNKT